MEVSTHRLNPLEHLVEDLDGDYACEWSDPTKLTEGMKRAEAEFLAAVLREYKVCGMEEVPGTRTTVNLEAWKAEQT